ncbi:MAG: hypothetical protein RL660_226 [Bacteroidota bacterium]|jgi:hypothetical protein
MQGIKTCSIVISASLFLIGGLIGWYSHAKVSNTEKVKTETTIVQNEDLDNVSLDIEQQQNDLECADYIVKLNPLIVRYAENAMCKCDTAMTTLEINFCTNAELCVEQHRFKLLNEELLRIYDSLIQQQEKEVLYALEIKDSTMLEAVTDYKSIKELHQQSIKSYIDYVEAEYEIQDLLIGIGREHIAWANYRSIALLKPKIKELRHTIREYR